MYRDRRRRSRLSIFLRLVAALAHVGSLSMAAAIGTNALGAKDRFDGLVERVDRFFNPPPDIAIEDETATARATPLPVVTPEPTPAAPTPPLAPADAPRASVPSSPGKRASRLA